MSTTDVTPPSVHVVATSQRRRRHLWRSRWAAIGAAVAVTLGGGTLHLASATDSEPSSIISVTPTRILDTRDPVDLGLAGPFVSAVGQNLQVTGSVATPSGPQTVVPNGATGVLLNVTVVQPTAAGFISVRPSGTPGPPETSSLNFEAGDITPNAVFVALPTSGPNAGQVEITYDAFGTVGPTTDVLGDVVGYTMENPDVYTKAEADAIFATTSELTQNYMTEDEVKQLLLTKAKFSEMLSAVVGADGELKRTSHTGTTASPISPGPDGRYQVTFPRSLTKCSFQATLGLWTSPFQQAPSNQGIVAVTNIEGQPNAVRVLTRTEDGTDANRPFHLHVHCWDVN